HPTAEPGVDRVGRQAMNFASLPDRRAELDPLGPAVSDGTRSLTNAQVLSRVRAAAAHLRDLGISPGDVVALKLTNRIEFVLLLFASWRLGATVTPVNPCMTEVEVTRQLNDAGAPWRTWDAGLWTSGLPTGAC